MTTALLFTSSKSGTGRKSTDYSVNSSDTALATDVRKTDTHLLDLLADTPWAGRLRSRRMFGGFGLYCDDFGAGPHPRPFAGHGLPQAVRETPGLLCGIVMNDTLYLKTDSDNRPQFVARGLAPFIYQKQGKPTPLSYYQAPAEALEDGAELSEWLESARRAAVRAATRKSRKSLRKEKR